MDKAPLQLRSAENKRQHADRRVLAQTLIIVAILLILFAIGHHVIPVIVETRDETIPPPKEISAVEAINMSPEELDKALNPDPVIEKRLETQQMPEQAIIRDVTIGGVVYLPDGTIKRTYGEGEATADVCPT